MIVRRLAIAVMMAPQMVTAIRRSDSIAQCRSVTAQSPDQPAEAISTSLAMVLMLRAVPVRAAGILSFELAIPSP
jgi:hypothetical protein